MAYDNPAWVLDGVDLAIEKGQFVAIMGVTGGGKSTLCLALNGIVPHSTGGTIGGDVWVGGANTKTQAVADLSQAVGLVFQQPETQLFNMTVEAEIAFGLETLGLPVPEIKERIDWALKLVGMDRFQHHSPFELSGGQRQRVAVAAILAMKPPVLVLDEPTANLDPAGKREVFAAVDQLRQREEMTIIMVSHESEQIASFADRVVVLDDGKIVIDGPPESIFSAAESIDRLGLSVPQMNQLAVRLNEIDGAQFDFASVEDGVAQLANRLSWVEAADEPSGSGTAQNNRPIFIVENLTFRYGDYAAALNGVSLQIERGDFIAILGQNGSGKTTLVKQLNGLLRPTEGRVTFGQTDVKTASVSELAHSIGFVFQNPDHMIFNPTVREEVGAGPKNLGLSEDEVKNRVEQVLSQFGLQNYADMQPAVLSFGLRRKVSVAAVVAMQTDVLILDEPTSGLDARSTAEMMQLLGRLHNQGRTIIMITHEMNVVAEHIPHVILMDGGRNIFQGATAELFSKPNLLRKTGLERPEITELGAKLGIKETILSIDDFLRRIEVN